MEKFYFRNYVEILNNFIDKHHYIGVRLGQLYFNMLFNYYPDIANQIVGTELDTFYNDRNIPYFLKFLITVCEGKDSVTGEEVLNYLNREVRDD